MKNKKNTFKNEKGTTLVEVMLSVALLAIIVTPLLGAVTSSVKNTSAAKDKTEAIALAGRVMGEIKAWKTIASTLGGDEILYPTSIRGDLEAYYKIMQEQEGRVDKNSAYTYVIPPDNSFDIELVINQGEDKNDKQLQYIKLYQIDNGQRIQPGVSINDFSVDNSSLELNIMPFSKIYSIQKKEIRNTEEIKTPFGMSALRDESQMKLKVTNETTDPNIEEQLKIYTNLFSDIDFKVYAFNTELDNSGVNFINEGETKFEVNYIDSNEFAYKGEPLNRLFKVNVIIKDASKKVIYQTTSYIKK